MKKTEPASQRTLAQWDSIAAALAPSGVERGAMLGMPSLKVNGKAIGGLFADALVFKLFGAAHAEALALPRAELFDPSGMERR